MFKSKIGNWKLEIGNSVLNQNDSERQGFTLIEAIVSTAVFAFLISSVLGVYMATLQLDKKSKAFRVTTQNARFISEYINKEVTNGSVNYGGTNNTSTLSLINQNNETETIQLSGDNLTLSKIINSSSVSTNLNSDQVKITKAAFLLNPASNPFTPAKNVNIQPSITVILELTSDIGGSRVTDMSKINIQNTYTVRNYPSRQ